MKNTTIVNLFPSPVAVYEINRDFTKQEIEQMEVLCANQENNFGNTNSKDKYCLNNEAFLDIKKFCSDALDDYMVSVVASNTGVCKITQSWVNVSRKDQYHHRHSHPNSYLSGVFYFETNENDKISFHNQRVTHLLPPINDLNTFNATNWWLWAIKGTLVVFPSWQEHSVPRVTYDRRVSLSFNSFLHGDIGTDEDLTRLYLGHYR